MKKLKNILQYDNLFYLLLFISLIIMVVKINIIPKSIYNEENDYVEGYVTDYKLKDTRLTIYLKSKENIVIYSKENYNLSYGDYIYVKGEFNLPNNNTNFNLFNYKKYLLSKKIKYTVTAKSIKVIRKNNNIFYKIKNYIFHRINRCKKTSNYLKTFIFADKNYIENDLIENYQKLGISHLLAVSGMHVSFISLILLKLLSFIKENIRYIVVCIILLFYLFLTGFSVSMLRSCLQFILIFINKILKLNIKNKNIVILIFSIILLFNPYNIYNIGFLFSFSVSYSLIRFNNLITNKKGIYKLFMVSIISFLSALPILINNFYQINLLSIIFNVFFVPFISYIIFPLSLLSLFIPAFDNLNYIFINIFENISNILSNIDILTINIAKIPVTFVIIYYVCLYLLLSRYSIKKVVSIVFLIILFIFYKSYIINPYITFIDVGQGDSILIRKNNKNILIDTGGKYNYDLSKKVLVPYLKSEGVQKINYLLITHGDFDHIGEAINLVNNFKVEKVIFNCGEYNDLEKELIKVLDKKKIKYYTCIKELNIDNNKLYFLQTKVYDNENDNSNVIYTELDGYKFMFMGDAGVDKEKDILNKYNITNIDVLKVGHHGSKTSSGKDFINGMNPKYSIISVGKNNRYGHPNKEVLNNLEDSKIYRTDQNGSVIFKIKNNKLQVEICSP